MAKIDWVQAQKDYVENPTITLKQIAEKYGVSESAVEDHASKEKWGTNREVVQHQTITQASEIIVNRNAQINEKHQRQYEDMQKLAINMVRIAAQTIAKAANEKGIDNLTVYEQDFIKPGSLKAIYESLKIAMDGERVTVGLPTSVERKEFTGKDGADLFAKLEPDEFYAHLERAYAALGTGDTGSNGQGASGGGTSEGR